MTLKSRITFTIRQSRRLWPSSRVYVINFKVDNPIIARSTLILIQEYSGYVQITQTPLVRSYLVRLGYVQQYLAALTLTLTLFAVLRNATV